MDMTYGANCLVVAVLCAGVLSSQACHGQVQANQGPESRPVPADSTRPQALLPSAATYGGFIAAARALETGATRADIIAALGVPAEAGETFLRYSLVDLPGFPGIPGPVGTQVFPGVRIELQAGHMARPIEWAWIDTTGSAPPPGPPLPATYQAFIARAGTLKPGTFRPDIIAALGPPAEDGGTFLRYSLSGLRGFPRVAAPGATQIIGEARIELHEGSMVGPIGWVRVDAAGPPHTGSPTR
jgi:hypothetical protein